MLLYPWCSKTELFDKTDTVVAGDYFLCLLGHPLINLSVPCCLNGLYKMSCCIINYRALAEPTTCRIVTQFNVGLSQLGPKAGRDPQPTS